MRREAKSHLGAVQVPGDAAFVGDMTGVILCLHPPLACKDGKLHKMAYKLWAIRGNLRVWGGNGPAVFFINPLACIWPGEATRTLHD